MYSIGNTFKLKGPWIGPEGEVVIEDNTFVVVIDPKEADPYNSLPLPENHYWVENIIGDNRWMITPDLLTPA